MTLNTKLTKSLWVLRDFWISKLWIRDHGSVIANTYILLSKGPKHFTQLTFTAVLGGRYCFILVFQMRKLRHGVINFLKVTAGYTYSRAGGRTTTC